MPKWLGLQVKAGIAAFAATLLIAVPALQSAPTKPVEPIAAPVVATQTLDVNPVRFVNPLVTWGTLFANTGQNLAEIGGILIEEPAPILTQIGRNQLANIAYFLAVEFNTYAQLGRVALEVPGAVFRSFTLLLQGRFEEAAAAALVPLEDAIRIANEGHADLLPILWNTLANAGRVALRLPIVALLVTPALIGTALSVAWVLSVSGAGLLLSVLRGDPVTFVSHLLNDPVKIVDALLNGHEFQIGFSINLPLIGSVGVSAELGLPGLLGGNPTGFTIDAPFLPPAGIHFEVIHGVIPTLLNQRDFIAGALRPIPLPGAGTRNARLEIPALPRLELPPPPALPDPVAGLNKLAADVPAQVERVTDDVTKTVQDVSAEFDRMVKNIVPPPAPAITPPTLPVITPPRMPALDAPPIVPSIEKFLKDLAPAPVPAG
ncbi:hypothetical protein V1Y59_18525 [Gordonia sp. PKS22-38]|uniref:PE-PGRS family protein n=1 Tax=Gordonia prachuapensis TaxID=3115651 RepID=A0ABU7MXR1_9ACTN|nr:hypothetical protein [Gordonia sp. PKS22-38]